MDDAAESVTHSVQLCRTYTSHQNNLNQQLTQTHIGVESSVMECDMFTKLA